MSLLWRWVVGVSALATLTACQSIAINPAASTTTTTLTSTAWVRRPTYNTGAGLFVLNGVLYDSNGTVFKIRGTNLDQPLGTNSQPGLSNANVNAVRFAVRYDDAEASTYATYIQDSVAANDEVAIPVFFRDSSGTNTTGSAADTGNGSIANAVSWWISNYSVLAPYQKHLIINVANEWEGSSVSDWVAQYERAIASLRAAGYTCPIMIDAKYAATDVPDLEFYAGAIFKRDPQKNIIFGVHEYSTAPTFLSDNYASVLASLSAATGAVFALMEFGPAAADGAATPQQLISAADAAGIGWASWAWDDPAAEFDLTVGGSGVFTETPATAATSTQLTPYGQVVVPYYSTAVKATDFP